MYSSLVRLALILNLLLPRETWASGTEAGGLLPEEPHGPFLAVQLKLQEPGDEKKHEGKRQTSDILKVQWKTVKRQAELRHKLVQAKKRQKNRDHKKRQRERHKAVKEAKPIKDWSDVLSGALLSVVFPFIDPEDLWSLTRMSQGVYRSVNKQCACFLQDPSTKKRAQEALEDQGPLQNWRGHKTPFALYLHEYFRKAVIEQLAQNVRKQKLVSPVMDLSLGGNNQSLRHLWRMIACGYGGATSLFDDDLPDDSEVAEFQASINELAQHRRLPAARLLDHMIAQGNPLACRYKFVCLCNSQIIFSIPTGPHNYSPLYPKGRTWGQARDFFDQLVEAGDPEAASLNSLRLWIDAILFTFIRTVASFCTYPCVSAMEINKSQDSRTTKNPDKMDGDKIRSLNEWLIENGDRDAISRKLRELWWGDSSHILYTGPSPRHFLEFALQTLNSSHLADQHKDLIGEFMIQCALCKITLRNYGDQVGTHALFERLMAHEKLKDCEALIITRTFAFMDKRFGYPVNLAMAADLIEKYGHFQRFYRLISAKCFEVPYSCRFLTGNGAEHPWGGPSGRPM